MLIQRLRVQSFRGFQEAELSPQPGFNLITGANGSGKSSLLEALHLMAHGRSFRGRVRDGLIRHGAADLQVVVDWTHGAQAHRAGLRHAGSNWEARLDGASVSQLGTLYQALAVVTFEPGSHALVQGSAEVRRRFLDWGLFHVEPGFMPVWRRNARALRQRNALLRTRQAAQLDAWDQELALAGETLSEYREAYVASLLPHLQAVLAELLPAAGAVQLAMQPGWRRQELALVDALLLGRERDLLLAHTSLGPHRADLLVRLRELPGREGLSRGQAKLVALALLLAQAAQLAEHGGEWPVLCLDDLASELDRNHQGRVLRRLQACGAQVLITGTEPPPGLVELASHAARFHVEHGSVSRLD